MGRFFGGLVTFTSIKSCWQSTVKEDKNRANLVAASTARAGRFCLQPGGWQGDRGPYFCLLSSASAGFSVLKEGCKCQAE